MLGLSRATNKIRYFFNDTNEYFYLLDFGSQYVKFGLLAVDKVKDTSRLVDVVEVFYPQQGTYKLNIGAAESACREGLRALHAPKQAKAHTAGLVIGLSPDMVYGDSASYFYKRDNSDEPIDMRELKNVFHKAELHAYENIRKKFNEETGLEESEVHLIDSAIQAIKLDDRKVSDPVGHTGSEIFVSIFNAYLPIFCRKFFDDLARRLHSRIVTFVYEPYALAGVLIKHENPALDAVILDIGGRATSVSLLRHGQLTEIKTFSFGGESFTRRIASALNLSTQSAETVKRRYSANFLSARAQKALDNILHPELSIFLSALELILKEFSQINLLPGRIYLHGGGGALPLIAHAVRHSKWRKNMSFISSPRARTIVGNEFKTQLPGHLNFHPQLVSLLALADHTLHHTAHKQNDLSHVLRRMVSLIQA